MLALTFTPCTLTFVPCTCGFSLLSNGANISFAHVVVSLSATCAGGAFSFSHWHKNCTGTRATYTVWWWSVVAVVNVEVEVEEEVYIYIWNLHWHLSILHCVVYIYYIKYSRKVYRRYVRPEVNILPRSDIKTIYRPMYRILYTIDRQAFCLKTLPETAPFPLSLHQRMW